jgi:uncharacterized membrane protein
MLNSRNVLNSVFLVTLAYNIYSYFILPDNPAIHFGSGGEPNDWASKGMFLLFSLGILAIIYLSFYLSPKIIEKVPAKYVSLPNNEYWLSDENKPEAIRKITGMMDTFGSVTGLLLLAISVLTVKANQSDPVLLNEDITWLLFILYLGYTVWWAVRLLIAFKVPEK